ncbi:DUF6631 family protein [Acinetobacter bereziniae]|uniref:DUF6631 family protein n=1 Tax=Acinetobacter bereziniae TaxID=106648 RepID=UPI0006690B87|nr:DUF6631 family protein [Acinetobacter bereziniae]
MAERYQQPSQENSAAQAAEDLAVLFPDQIITLQGQAITVTEYPFMTWLALKPLCTEIIQQFANFMQDDQEVFIDDFLECFENNFDIIQKLLSESIHQPISFLEPLLKDEMDNLLLTWWGVNKHFFLQGANRIVRKIKTTTQQQSDGQTSSSA